VSYEQVMIVIVILSLVSIFGYATFMLHPEFLEKFWKVVDG
jgi:hypothetical protein